MPKCPIDWEIFKFFTQISDSTIISSKTVRWEGNREIFKKMNENIDFSENVNKYKNFNY